MGLSYVSSGWVFWVWFLTPLLLSAPFFSLSVLSRFCCFVAVIIAGMSISPTPNPLKHVLNAIGEDVEWLTYGTVGRDTV